MVTGPDQAGPRPEPLTDEELARLDRWVRAFIQNAGDATALNERCAADVTRLVAEVHRLRELIALAYHSVPERAETRDLMAKLKAEVDR
jgi:hypothetical protein